MDRPKHCTFVSVWDGGLEIESAAVFNPDTGIVSDIQMAQLNQSILVGLDVPEREFIRVDGKEYDLVENDDGTYSAIRPYEVFFSRNGYAVVHAPSAQEAIRIADEELKYDDVSWDDDWHPTDVQVEE